MSEERAHAFFDHAIKKLNEANDELFRPEEDMVTFTVCKNSQFAVESYLKGYLTKNNVSLDGLDTIELLFNACKKINKNFERIDFKGFDCIGHKIDSRYCNETERVSNCFNIADSIDTLLRKEKIIS